MAPMRKSFSTKFKAKALKYITEKGCSNSEAARNFGVDENNIRRWKGQSDSHHKAIKNWFSKVKQLPGSGRRPLSELSPDELDYEQLKRKEGSKGSVCVDIEDGVLEENLNEIVIDNLLDISEDDLGIVLQN